MVDSWADTPLSGSEAKALCSVLLEHLEPESDKEHPLIQAFLKDFYEQNLGRFTTLLFWTQAHHIGHQYPQAIAALARRMFDE